ncbi:MAG: transcription antitermination factor NusB, partial [Candidatus Cloacimonetes bacterium]|nr:transcription antitermination factor NusB [Candidatus Cloacimonadota bacterium]
DYSQIPEGMDRDPDHALEKLQEISQDIELNPESKIYEFAVYLLGNIVENIDTIDRKINECSINWPLERIANLDRCILRIAIYELLYTDTASPIIMNEAIEISKKYCSESSGKYINGVLNAAARSDSDG